MTQKRRRLIKQYLCSHDPLYLFLVKICHVNPWFFALCICLSGIILSLLIALITGTLDSKCGSIGLMNDWLPWTMVLIVGPCISWTYLWSFDTIHNLLKGFRSSYIKTLNNFNTKELILKYHNIKWRGWEKFLGLGYYYIKRRRREKFLGLGFATFASFCVCTTLPKLEGYWAHSSPSSLINIGTTLATFIIVYMATISIWNLLENLWILYYIFHKKNIKINFFHPDSCCGLRFLSKYCFKISCIVIVLGFWLGAVQFQLLTNWIEKKDITFLFQSLGLFITYLSFSLIFLLGPRLIVCKPINQEKDKLLKHISDEFEKNEFEKNSSNFKDIQSYKDKNQELSILYNTVDKFNPLFFDIKYLNIYISTLPLLSQLTGILFPKLIDKLLAIIN